MPRAGPTPDPGQGTGTGGRQQRARGGGVTPESWAVSLLQALGYPATRQNVQSIVAWEAREGGNWNNRATYNPLNTKEAEPGSVNATPGGVQAYDSWASGLQATVTTLQNGNYPDILRALRTGKGLFGRQFKGLAKWSGGLPGGYDTLSPRSGYGGGPGSTVGQVQTAAAEPASCALHIPGYTANFFGVYHQTLVQSGCLLYKSQVRALLGAANLLAGAGLVIVGAGYILGSSRPARMILNVAAFAVPGGGAAKVAAAAPQAAAASKRAASSAPEAPAAGAPDYSDAT